MQELKIQPPDRASKPKTAACQPYRLIKGFITRRSNLPPSYQRFYDGGDPDRYWYGRESIYGERFDKSAT